MLLTNLVDNFHVFASKQHLSLYLSMGIWWIDPSNVANPIITKNQTVIVLSMCFCSMFFFKARQMFFRMIPEKP